MKEQQVECRLTWSDQVIMKRKHTLSSKWKKKFRKNELYR